MTSPLSVGDCIAIIGVLIKGYKALRGISGDIKDLEDLENDLQQMQIVLEQFPEPGSPSASSIPEVHMISLSQTVKACQGTLMDMAAVAKQYGPSKLKLKTYYRRLYWSFGGKNQLNSFQLRVQRHSSTMSLLLLDINRNAINDVHIEVRERADDLSLQLRGNTNDIKYHIYAAVQEPWDQRPIGFHDAMGRKFPVPMVVCQRFEFWLFTPSNSGSPWWYLINEEDWEVAARPGATFGMSLFHMNETKDGDEATVCGRCGENKLAALDDGIHGPNQSSAIRFSRPVPRWSTLPEDTEFRWWSRPAIHGPVAMKETACEDTHMQRQRIRKQARQSCQIMACHFHKLDPAVYWTCDAPGWRHTRRQAFGDGQRHPDRRTPTHSTTSNMGRSPDFCLMCEKQTDNKTYCSESCRLADRLVSPNSGQAPSTPPRIRMRQIRTRNLFSAHNFAVGEHDTV